MSKGRFVARFLAIFALLAVLFALAGAPARYATLSCAAAGFVGPVVSGWWVEVRGSGSAAKTWLRRGNEALLFRISLETLALGFIPMLALIGATPMTLQRWAFASALGVLALFALHLLVVLVYPLLVEAAPPPELVRPRDGALPRVAGQFIGFLAFVGGPVIVWFVLTFEELRSVWRLPAETTEQRA